MLANLMKYQLTPLQFHQPKVLHRLLGNYKMNILGRVLLLCGRCATNQEIHHLLSMKRKVAIINCMLSLSRLKVHQCNYVDMISWVLEWAISIVTMKIVINLWGKTLMTLGLQLFWIAISFEAKHHQVMHSVAQGLLMKAMERLKFAT